MLIISSVFLVQGNGTGAQVPKHGGTYTEGLVGQPRFINPLLSQANDVDADLTRILFSGLYKFDSNLNLVPDLAKELPKLSVDGKVYTITLKENLFWHDGQPITADDVVFTLQAIQNPEYQSPLRLSWNKVEVSKIDALTIKIAIREAYPPFIANLTTGIIPKHIWESIPPSSFAPSKYQLEPIGSGPFRFVEMKRARDGAVRSITLASFDKYHEGEAYIAKVNFKFYNSTDELIASYQSRDISGLGFVAFDNNLFLKPSDKLVQYELPLPQYQAVFFNPVKNPAALNDVRTRKALAKAVDRNRIIQEIYGGHTQGAYGPILGGHLGYHEQIPGADMNIYDPEAAKKLLQEAGWILDPQSGERKDKQGRVITVSLATSNNSPNTRTAELLKEMWQAVGVQVTLNLETAADLEDNFIRPRNYELLLYSENVGPDPDPYAFWHSSQAGGAGLNLTGFNNKQADRLLVEARGNVSAETRAQKYRQFQEIFVGDVPAVFLVQSVYVYDMSKNVKGVELKSVVTPSERFASINKWYLETKKVN